MKRDFFLFLLFAFLSIKGIGQTDTVTLTGVYQGKNIFLDKTSLCLKTVYVNGLKYDYEKCYSGHPLYEIDFTCLPLVQKVGDKVTIKIIKTKGCKLKVTNPEVLLPKPTFNIISIKVDSSCILHWKTSGEAGILPFIIEAYRWKKWVKVGEIEGLGTSGENEYAFKIKPNSGENMVRISQTGFSGISKRTDSLFFKTDIPTITIKSQNVTKEIVFSSATMYQLYNHLGVLLKEGYGNAIVSSDLKKGVYYLNYDNTTIEIFKKK